MKHEPLDFSTILATSIHDMKNSLAMVLQSIEDLDLADNLTTQQHKSVANFHYQTSRINSTLMQLLALYREKHDELPIHIEENSVKALLTDVLDKNRLYLNSHHIKIKVDVEENLYGYYDIDLITYLLSDVFVNALRHTKDTVMLTAKQDNGLLVFTVEDNGEGYPDYMLNINELTFSEFKPIKGRSGLGLIFAKKIAEAHQLNNIKGSINLTNKPNNTGSIFTLNLP
jgi:signal transduction histidine kinase